MSTRVETRCKVKVYEVNGEDTPVHWVYDDRVVLVIGRKRYTVVADDIAAAVCKASR